MVLYFIQLHNFYGQVVNGVENVVIFGFDNSSSVHLDNKEKDILFLGKRPTKVYKNVTKMYQFKGTESEIKPYTPCLGNISKVFTMDNMKKTGCLLFLLIIILLILTIFLNIHKYL